MPFGLGPKWHCQRLPEQQASSFFMMPSSFFFRLCLLLTLCKRITSNSMRTQPFLSQRCQQEHIYLDHAKNRSTPCFVQCYACIVYSMIMPAIGTAFAQCFYALCKSLFFPLQHISRTPGQHTARTVQAIG